MEKYYMPSVEEFHLGFECEIASYGKENKWVKFIYNSFTDSIFCKDSNGKIWVNDNLRVKYLDQEDIESLGWILDTRGTYDLDNWSLKHWAHEGRLSIIIRDPSKSQDYMLKHVMTSANFITIRNKSELKRLMNQLNILK